MSTKKLQVIDYTVKQAENADTVDGKHASEFASATDMATAQSDISDLQTKVGDTAVSTQITNAIANKVDKVDGKGLSTNDYTAAEKTKLAGITDSADSVSFSANATSGNKVGTITINGTATGMYSPTQTTVSGNAGTATKLETTRTIDGVSFDGTSDIIHYGVCSTSAATADKVVTITGFKLVSGAHIAVNFTYANTASLPTLNVNSTGAKSIYTSYSSSSWEQKTYMWNGGAIVEFVYNGSGWVMVNYPDSQFVTQLDGTSNNSFNVGSTTYSTVAGTLPIANGGTGATTAATAITNLGAIAKSDIVNNLTSTATAKPLSAKQGKILYDTLNSPTNLFSQGTVHSSLTVDTTLSALYKIGRLCILDFAATAKADLGTWQALYVQPTTCNPVVSTTWIGLKAKTSTIFSCQLASDGLNNRDSSISSGDDIRIHLAYISNS